MDGIGRQLKDLAGFSEQAYQDRSHDMSTLHARVDSLEKISLKPRIDSLESKVFGSRDSLPLAESTDDGTGHSRVAALSSRQRDDELAQMRFQIVNLKQQFGQAMEQLQKSNGSRPGRRSAGPLTPPGRSGSFGVPEGGTSLLRIMRAGNGQLLACVRGTA